FGAVERQELPILGDLVVAPDVVGDGGIDVALQVGVVRQPAAGLRVQVQDLGFLAAVAAALPGIHGALETGGARQPPGGVETPETAAQQRAGDLGNAVGQEREDEQFVPEDMAAV